MYFGSDCYCESKPVRVCGQRRIALRTFPLHTHTFTHSHTCTLTRTDVAYKFEDLLQPPAEEREGGETSDDATITYEQEDDSELTLDYEQEEPVKDEEKVEKDSVIHTGVEEKEKEAVESKKRKLEDSSSEPPPSAKRTLSCANKKKEELVVMAEEGQGDQQGEKDGKETVDGSSVSVNVKSAAGAGGVGAAAAAKPSLEKKDSMEENLICQICQV